ncbi:acetyl-CoA C-acetyltransferase [Amylibacter sp.]|nr:acetyl-CoA C-acetyltransferase [Amylibacter sp.]
MVSSKNSVVIVSAKRSAIGSFCGSLSSIPAHEIGSQVIKDLIKETAIDASQVDEIILGQVLTAGQGQNPARQAAIMAGLPVEKTAVGINQVCGAGLRAVAMGMQQLSMEDANIIIAGGQESMSFSHHSSHMRNASKMGNTEFIDTMIKDGLWDAFHGYHMGITAENVADKFKISREAQDLFSVKSQNKAEKAKDLGNFKAEITPISTLIKKSELLVDEDEYIRNGATLEALQKLRPAFSKHGTVTAGNASGLNDGAAVVMMMREKEALERGLRPLARIASWATAGVPPELMGTGPIPASRQALQKAGWKVNDLDLIEANEAFAAQAIAVNQEMNWDPSIVNVNGGAISLGHPIGASGCRILVTLLHEMQRSKKSKGLATLCIGGGMGIALTVESFI